MVIVTRSCVKYGGLLCVYKRPPTGHHLPHRRVCVRERREKGREGVLPLSFTRPVIHMVRPSPAVQHPQSTHTKACMLKLSVEKYGKITKPTPLVI